MSLFELLYSAVILIGIPLAITIALIVGLANTRLTEMGEFGTFVAVVITTLTTIGVIVTSLDAKETAITTPIASHVDSKINLLGKQIDGNDYQHDFIIDGEEETVDAQRSIVVYDKTGERLRAITTLGEHIIIGDTVYDYEDVAVDWELYDETVTSRNWANAVISRKKTKKLRITITLPDDYKSEGNTWK